MRKLLLAATAVVSLGGLGAATLLSQAGAQPVPPSAPGDPPPGPGAAPPAPGGQTSGGWWRGGGWRMGPRAGGQGWHEHATERLRTFALVYRADDRHLTPPDVQKIAEGFLLWNGNHTWKVIDVAAAADNQIGFSLATADGSVIARFNMDAKTGRVTRLG
jgi:hypothetical protein